jgi:hypothetical protein
MRTRRPKSRPTSLASALSEMERAFPAAASAEDKLGGIVEGHGALVEHASAYVRTSIGSRCKNMQVSDLARRSSNNGWARQWCTSIRAAGRRHPSGAIYSPVQRLEKTSR